jgi:hypothetical protein
MTGHSTILIMMRARVCVCVCVVAKSETGGGEPSSHYLFCRHIGILGLAISLCQLFKHMKKTILLASSVIWNHPDSHSLLLSLSHRQKQKALKYCTVTITLFVVISRTSQI